MKVDIFGWFFLTDLRTFEMKIKKNERFKTLIVNLDQALVH